MNERQLANNIRIQIIEKISEIDLPAFLFAEIDHALSMLNYFKLSNLLRNAEQYCQFLLDISRSYFEHMCTLCKKTARSFSDTYSQTDDFYTENLYAEGVHIYCTNQQLLGVEGHYRVTCLLKMKEFINRRMLQRKIMNGKLKVESM